MSNSTKTRNVSMLPGNITIIRRGSVAVTCWCERKVVHIDPKDVGNTTMSCGHAECRP